MIAYSDYYSSHDSLRDLKALILITMICEKLQYLGHDPIHKQLIHTLLKSYHAYRKIIVMNNINQINHVYITIGKMTK